MSRKERLQMAKSIADNAKLPMSRVTVLLYEMDSLECALERAQEINAERGMSAVAMGFSPYDIERVNIGREMGRLNEIYGILYPKPEVVEQPLSSEDFQFTLDISDEDLPF
jgi:hypothetical protein